MENKNKTRIIIILAIVVLSIGLDQWSKVAIRENVNKGQKISLIGDMLTMTNVENSGAFLGMGSELPDSLRIILFIVLPIVMLLGILVFVLIKKDWGMFLSVTLALIVGGGIGNLIDRIAKSSVTDFLHIDLGIVQTGVFNVADMAVMAGTIMIGIHTFMNRKEEAEEENEKPTEETNPVSEASSSADAATDGGDG